MSVQFSIATSVYTKQPLWALVVDDTGKFQVVLPSGEQNEDQTRRIVRRVASARKKPTTSLEVVKLASINMSAVAFGPLQDAESFDAARPLVTEQLQPHTA